MFTIKHVIIVDCVQNILHVLYNILHPLRCHVTCDASTSAVSHHLQI